MRTEGAPRVATSWGMEATRKRCSVATTVSEEKEGGRMALLCHN